MITLIISRPRWYREVSLKNWHAIHSSDVKKSESDSDEELMLSANVVQGTEAGTEATQTVRMIGSFKR